MRAPTGEQFTIAFDADGHRFEAVITEVAAGIRSFTYDGVDLVEPFAEDAKPAKAQGIVLSPWPGRVAKGRYTFDGAERRLVPSELATGNAIHGLLRFAAYRLVEQHDASVTLRATVFPQTGYDWQIDTTVHYALSAEGLTVTHTATNVGEGTAPYALGTHPYLAVGRTPAEQLTLTVPAATIFRTDDTLVPVAEVSVHADGAPGPDLRDGRRLAELDLDAGFGGVAHVDGRAVSSLVADDGRGVELWQGEAFGYVVVYTPHEFPAFDGERQVAAVEPMSAPANAFNSGDGLVRLAPGEQWTGVWGISPLGF